MSNQPSGNETLVVGRGSEGGIRLRNGASGRIATGGRGFNSTAPIDPLGSQNALIRQDNLLFAVNAGSNDVSSIRVSRNGSLELRDVARSGAVFPVSLAAVSDRLYAMNVAGSAPSIGILEIRSGAALNPLASVELGIATTDPFNHVMAPGQVILDADRRNIIVVDAGGQQLLAAPLDNDGMPSGHFSTTPVQGPVPFSMTATLFGHVLVADASGSVSSFNVERDGSLTLLAGQQANGQMATCCILPISDSVAVTTNTNSGTLSTYHYSRGGGLSLINAMVVSPGGAPTDIGVDSEGGEFLNAFDPAGGGAVLAFRIDKQAGTITLFDRATGLPANAGIQCVVVI